MTPPVIQPDEVTVVTNGNRLTKSGNTAATKDNQPHTVEGTAVASDKQPPASEGVIIINNKQLSVGEQVDNNKQPQSRHITAKSTHNAYMSFLEVGASLVRLPGNMEESYRACPPTVPQNIDITIAILSVEGIKSNAAYVSHLIKPENSIT